VQEVTGREAEDAGRIPRTVEAELREQLVDAAAVGDIVRVLGFVKVLNADAAAGEGCAQTVGIAEVLAHCTVS
jgi:DNA helicase MCM8